MSWETHQSYACSVRLTPVQPFGAFLLLVVGIILLPSLVPATTLLKTSGMSGSDDEAEWALLDAVEKSQKSGCAVVLISQARCASPTNPPLSSTLQVLMLEALEVQQLQQ